MSMEQAADLRALEAMAADGEMPGAEPAPAGPSQGEQWAMIPAMLGSALAMALPDLREVYSQSACLAWGEAMAPVAKKYGWDADALACPEVGLLCASLPLALGTITAVQRHKAAAAKAGQGKPPAVAAPTEPVQVVGAGTVHFGQPQPA